MSRPAVDVVVPFRGSAEQLAALRKRLSVLELREEDTLTVADFNDEIATPGHSRNRGAATGSAEWLVFIDADVTPSPDLLDRYFEPPPAKRTAILAGGIEDEPVPADGPAIGRYQHVRRFMSQDDTMRIGEWAFPKTANAAVRRSAFEAVGGFEARARAAEDADLTFRLKAAGWEVERRDHASVVHHNRATLSGFVAQKLVHGSGGSWLQRRHPGSSPSRRLPGLAWWGVRHAARGLIASARARNRDGALVAVLLPLELFVHELGRLLPNERAGAARRRARAQRSESR